MNFDWTDLAFASKKPLSELDAIFIAAPREFSPDRFKQIIKTYLPHGHIILGLAKEPYVLGLENQPQFKMLEAQTVRPIIDQVNIKSPHKIATLSYFQRDLPFILEKINIRRAVFINGSWYQAFHLHPEYYALTRRRIDYELISPFTSETEAHDYAAGLPQPPRPTNKLLTEAEMLQSADDIAKYSLAYSEFQTGVSLGRRKGSKYELMLTEFNPVVPYQTYAMHHGASRERNFSPMNDLNHYDVNHAEVQTIVTAGRKGIDLAGTTLFINLLPCPTCARMFMAADIAEFVYREDHSAGYAIKMLELAGKTVRRLVV
jgi:hypothetical protein